MVWTADWLSLAATDVLAVISFREWIYRRSELNILIMNQAGRIIIAPASPYGLIQYMAGQPNKLKPCCAYILS